MRERWAPIRRSRSWLLRSASASEGTRRPRSEVRFSRGGKGGGSPRDLASFPRNHASFLRNDGSLDAKGVQDGRKLAFLARDPVGSHRKAASDERKQGSERRNLEGSRGRPAYPQPYGLDLERKPRGLRGKAGYPMTPCPSLEGRRRRLKGRRRRLEGRAVYPRPHGLYLVGKPRSFPPVTVGVPPEPSTLAPVAASHGKKGLSPGRKVGRLAWVR